MKNLFLLSVVGMFSAAVAQANGNWAYLAKCEIRDEKGTVLASDKAPVYFNIPVSTVKVAVPGCEVAIEITQLGWAKNYKMSYAGKMVWANHADYGVDGTLEYSDFLQKDKVLLTGKNILGEGKELHVKCEATSEFVKD